MIILSMLYTALLISYIVIAIGIVISLLLNGVRPAKTLAWLLAIFTIPVGGILLYLLVGRNRRKRKLLHLKKRIVGQDIAGVENRLPRSLKRYEKMARLLQKSGDLPVTSQNKVVYLKDGKTTFENIFMALESATSYIHLQYYIFEEGELADQLLVLFKEKVKLGVKIRLIYDGIGSFSLSKFYLKKLKAIGVEVYSFLPFQFGRFLASLNYRNHRKIIVVDGKMAFTGGINVSDKYLKGDPNLGKWHDMHLKLEGPAVGHLDQVFEQDWHLVSNQPIDTVVEAPQPLISDEDTFVQIVANGPDDDFPAIEQLYFTIINEANRYVYITNPYVIPGYAIMTALETAALSGIDVRLMVSAKNDSKLVNWTVRSYFEPLLKAGVKIYIFPDGFLHSKIMISDDAIASVGTANIDVRSFEQNYEVNAVVYDESFTSKLREDFLQDSTDSHLLTYEEHQKRPLYDKLKEGFAKVFSPVL